MYFTELIWEWAVGVYVKSKQKTRMVRMKAKANFVSNKQHVCSFSALFLWEHLKCHDLEDFDVLTAYHSSQQTQWRPPWC